MHHKLQVFDWVEAAKNTFGCEKPPYFTNYNHCDECAEHNQTLVQADIDTIGLAELGNPGWDPMCFCTVTGKKYYMPALIRLSLATIHTEFYLEQFLFHMNESLYQLCSPTQRQLIATFLEHVIEHYAPDIEQHACTDEIFQVHQLWSNP